MGEMLAFSMGSQALASAASSAAGGAAGSATSGGLFTSVLGVGSAFLKVASAGQQARRLRDEAAIMSARGAALNRQAFSLREQAELGLLDARQSEIRGKATANALREGLAGILATQRAIYGASGIDVGSGTPVAAADAARAEAGDAIDTALRDAAIEAAGKRIGASNLRADSYALDADAELARAQARSLRRQASNAGFLGFLGGGLSLIDYNQRIGKIG